MTIEGRSWVFAEANVNTDLMMPAALFRVPRHEQAARLFEGYRPGWAAQVRPGDVVIGGRNFGTGSSRPAAGLFVDLGVRAIVAESLNGLFMRNCINAGLAAMACPGVVELVAEGDIVSYEPGTGTIVNTRTAASSTGAALPAELLAIIADGGLFERLRRAGLLRARPRATPVVVTR